MDYLKASEMYKAVRMGGSDKPSKVYQIISEEKAEKKRPRVKSPRRAWYRTKDRNKEVGILIFFGAMMLLLALAGPRESDRIIGSIFLFILLVVGALV